MTKKELTAKEETFEALETLMFYHDVYMQCRYKDFDPDKYSIPVKLNKESLERLNDELLIEIKLSFKPEY